MTRQGQYLCHRTWVPLRLHRRQECNAAPNQTQEPQPGADPQGDASRPQHPCWVARGWLTPAHSVAQ